MSIQMRLPIQKHLPIQMSRLAPAPVDLSIETLLKLVLKRVLKELNGLTPSQNDQLKHILYNIMLKNEDKNDVQQFLGIHLQSHITCVNLGEFRIIYEKLSHLINISKDWSDDDRIHLETQITQFINIF